MLRNGLYIIATPIGNLKDISDRAMDVLQQAEIIACEDTRVTKKLFTLLGISLQKKFIAYEDHQEQNKAGYIADLIEVGNAVALVSDAGSPLISDPGYKLVRLCREQNLYITAIPGPCAVITALQLSGLPTNRFMFAGFIPNKDKARQDLFTELKNVVATLIFYETALRLNKTLAAMNDIFPNREISVVKEMTKIYETTVNGTAVNLIDYFNQNEPRGEFVVMVAPPQEENIAIENVREVLAKRMDETSLKTAVKEITLKYNLNKNEVYSLALELKNEQL